MAVLQLSKKAYYIGKWQEDTFSDEIFRNIAAHANAEKGKKVKIILNNEGLRMIKHRLLKDDEVEFYSFKNIKTVTKNPRSETCVMFILTDNVKKYQIVAVRCDSVTDVVYITNFYNQLRQNNSSFKEVELRKRSDTGNWTLRERSAHNASQHLKEVFKEQQRQNSVEESKAKDDNNIIKVNGVVTTTVTKAPNGILKQSSKEDKVIPYANISTEPTKTSTVTTTEWKAGKITAYSNGGVFENDDDVDADENMKALVEHAHMEQKLMGGGERGELLRAVRSVDHNDTSIPEGRIYATPGSRRVSTDYPLVRQYRPARAVPGRNSMFVRVENPLTPGSIRLNQRTSSVRTVPVKAKGNFTIQRSIEETYGKPVIMQQTTNEIPQPIIVQSRSRRGSGNSIILSRNKRPASIHVMGGNSFYVHQGTDGMKF